MGKRSTTTTGDAGCGDAPEAPRTNDACGPDNPSTADDAGVPETAWPEEVERPCSVCNAKNITVRRVVGRPGKPYFLCVHCREAR